MHDVACEFACAVRMRSSNGRERSSNPCKVEMLARSQSVKSKRLRKMHLNFLTLSIKHLATNSGGRGADCISGEGFNGGSIL